MQDLKYIQSIWEPTKTTNDIAYANGDIVIVENEDRLRQDITLILMTESGTLPYPNFGTVLPLMPGNTRFSQPVLDQVANTIVAALKYLVLLETSANYRERLASVDSLNVSYSNASITCAITATTLARSQAGISLTI